jgi:mono/diheme cytochrome c family protein
MFLATIEDESARSVSRQVNVEMTRRRRNNMRINTFITVLLSSAVIIFLIASVNGSAVSFLFAGTADEGGQAAQAQPAGSKVSAEKLFKESCGPCHEVDSLKESKGEILDNLNSGSMRGQASLLSPAEKVTVAEYIVAARALAPNAAPAAQPSAPSRASEQTTDPEPKTTAAATQTNEEIAKTSQAPPADSKSRAENLCKENCARCHDNGSPRGSKEEILENLISGSMKSQGSLLSAEEKEAVADYIVASRAAESRAAPANQPGQADAQGKPKDPNPENKQRRNRD